jgi:hypothetical protein
MKIVAGKIRKKGVWAAAQRKNANGKTTALRKTSFAPRRIAVRRLPGSCGTDGGPAKSELSPVSSHEEIS